MRRTGFRKAVCISVASAIALTGCATQKPPESESTYVGPVRYAHLDCDQLNAEAQRLLARYAELGGQLAQDAQDANAEKALLPLQVVSQIVWPLAILWLPFAPAVMHQREERDRRFIEGYRLMAECDAILHVAAKKGCPGVVPDPQQQALLDHKPGTATGFFVCAGDCFRVEFITLASGCSWPFRAGRRRCPIADNGKSKMDRARARPCA